MTRKGAVLIGFLAALLGTATQAPAQKLATDWDNVNVLALDALEPAEGVAGADPRAWGALANRGAARRHGTAWPGVALVAETDGERTLAVLRVEPDTGTTELALALSGEPVLELSAAGNLLLRDVRGDVVLWRPSAVQEGPDGVQALLGAQWVLKGGQALLALPKNDSKQPMLVRFEVQSLASETLRRRYDRNGDGRIQASELLLASCTPVGGTPTVTATNVDSFASDVDGDTRADPGDVVRHTLVISSGAGDANSLALAHTIDPDTTLVGGSVNVSPLARDDCYDALGNVTLNISTAGNALFQNDNDFLSDPFNLTAAGPNAGSQTACGAFPCNRATSGGGSVVLNSDGTFQYTPPTTGTTDSFAYTITDGGGLASVGTVTFSINGRVWFIKSDVAGPGTGTQADPFKLLSAVNGAGGAGDPDGPADYIYLHDTAALADHVGGIELEANQTLIGAGEALVVGPISILPAGTAPRLEHVAGNAITLAAGASILGLEINAANNAAIAGTGSLAGVTVAPSVSILTSGGASGIALTSHSGTVTIGAAISGTGTGPAISVNGGAGTLSMTGSVNKTAGALVSVQNKTGGSVSLAGVTGTGAATDAIVLQTNTGTTVNFNSGLAVTTTAGRGLFANNGGTVNIAGTGSTINATGGAALDVTGTSFGAGATFASASSTGSSAEGLRLSNVTGPVVINGGSLASSTGTAFSLAQGSANVTYAGTISKTTAGRAVDVQTRAGGIVTLSGAITASGASTGINVSGATAASTTTFSGAVDLGSGGSRLTGGTALTVNHGGTGSSTSFSDLEIFTDGQAGVAASNGGTLNVTTGRIDAQNARALNADTLALGTTFLGLLSTSSPTEGVRLNGTSGALTSVVTTISNPATQGLLVQASSTNADFGTTQVAGTGTQRILVTGSTGNVTFAGTTVSGGTDGVSLQNNSAGTRTFASLNVSTNNGVGFLHAVGGGTTTVTGTATITNPTGTGVDIQSSASAITFGGLTVNKGASTGTGMSLASNTVVPSFGVLTVTASNGSGLVASSSGANSTGGSIAATNGPAINATGGTFNLVLGGAGSTNSTGNGISLTNTAGTLTLGNSANITGATGAAFVVAGGTSTISYGGSITHSAASRLASITGRSSGSVSLDGTLSGTGSNTGLFVDSNSGSAAVTFTGANKSLSTGASAAVTVTNNGTATVGFTNGGLVLTTTAGAGFTSTGGGVVRVLGTGNTVTSTTGTPVNLNGITFGTGGINFESVSANGAANGIVIASTTAGGNSFTVTGVGTTAGSGGTLQNMTDDAVRITSASNVTLRNMNMNNIGNAAGEYALDLSSTSTIALDRVSINGTTDHGLNMNGGSGLQVNNSTVLNAGNAANEHAMNLVNVGGTVTVDATTLDAAADDLLRVTNANTNLTLNVQNGSILRNTGNTIINGNNGILVVPNGTSAVALSVTNSTFTNVRGVAAQLGAATAGSNGASSVTFTGNTISASVANKGGSVVLSSTEATTNTFTVSGNNWSGAKGPGLVTSNAINQSNLTAVIKDNVMTNGVDSVGIGVFVEDSATHSVTVHNNQITGMGSDGIQIANFGNNDAAATTATLNVRVTNNVINGHNSSSGGFAFIAGVSVFNFEDSLCLNLQNNSVTGTPLPVAAFFDYYLQRDAGTFRVQGATTAAVTSANIFGVLANTGDSTPPGQTTPSAGVVGTINFSNGAACATPAP
jgi:hypothetical protein